MANDMAKLVLECQARVVSNEKEVDPSCMDRWQKAEMLDSFMEQTMHNLYQCLNHLLCNEH